MKNTTEKTREKEVVKVTLVGSVVNFALMALKFTAGILGRSGAMIADAVHSLSDFLTDIVVVVFVKISSKPRDHDHKYGHGKFETLATAIIGIVLMFVGLKLMWDGGTKIYGVLFKGLVIESPGIIALIAALVSIVAKEILYRYTVIVGKKQNSQSVIANAWHHRSDAFSSIGTALGIGGAILLGDKWTILDPIAAVVVSVLIIRVAIQLVKPAMNDLLEKSLAPEMEDEIVELIMQTPGICDPHNLHTRSLGNCNAIEIHVRVRPEMSVSEAHDKTREIENRLRERFGADTHITLHVEPIKPGTLCSEMIPENEQP